MSKNRMVNTRFWNDGFVVDKLNALDRLLFLYLLTNDKTNILGIYELPLRTVAFETGIDRNDIENMLRRLSPKVEYFDGWVYIRQFTEHQLDNPKVSAGMVRSARSLPKKVLDKVINLGIDSDRLSKTINRLSIANTETTPQPELQPELQLPKGSIGGKNPPALKKTKRAPKPPSEVAKLYYDVIQALDVPVKNHKNVQAKIHEMELEKDRTRVIAYLTYMRDEFADANFPFKPDISEALDIHGNRAKIRNQLVRYQREQSRAQHD